MLLRTGQGSVCHVAAFATAACEMWEAGRGRAGHERSGERGCAKGRYKARTQQSLLGACATILHSFCEPLRLHSGVVMLRPGAMSMLRWVPRGSLKPSTGGAFEAQPHLQAQQQASSSLLTNCGLCAWGWASFSPRDLLPARKAVVLVGPTPCVSPFRQSGPAAVQSLSALW